VRVESGLVRSMIVKLSLPWFLGGAISIALVALFLRPTRMSNESVDSDGMFSRHVAMSEASCAWGLVRRDLLHPPLYYLPLKETLPSGRPASALNIRLLSLAAEVASTLIVILATSARELLVDTPQSIVNIVLTRHATLRKGFDDNCSALVRATMAADLTPDRSLPGRVHARIERGFSKVYFVPNFARGDKQAAAKLGFRLAGPTTSAPRRRSF
jgi:hypothetical protein